MSESDVYGRQILTYKDDLCAAGVNGKARLNSFLSILLHV